MVLGIIIGFVIGYFARALLSPVRVFIDYLRKGSSIG
jgi:hypothetical protein